MPNISHWTPRYIKNRIALFFYERAHPDHPWLTKKANEILNADLKSSDVGLEFGSGRSTIWLAKRVGKLTSVEHHEAWAATVKEMLDKEGIKNVTYRLAQPDAKEGEAGNANYVRIIDEFPDNSLDFCLVDGIYRDFCVLKVISKLRPGGLLIIDNVNRYLPSDSCSPLSRTFSDGPDGAAWKEAEKLISGWKRIWTSSGVTDTALFYKPN